MVKKKLCLVIPSLQAGGMERVMSELAGYFATKEEIDIHLVLYGLTREIFYEVPEGVAIHVPQFRFNNRFRLYYTLKTICFLRATIKKISPHCILSFGEYWNSLVLISIYGLDYPIYVSDRCQPDKSLGRFHNWLRSRLYPEASGIVAQTQKAKEIYTSQTLNKNIVVIGNPVRSISRSQEVPKEKVVLTVGRLIKTKNHDKLIEVFINISKPGWKLMIVGYDHLKQNISDHLKQIISEYHAEDKVLLEGKKADVETYYMKSSIFAFTSISEGFPNVIGEAMSAGLPVIAFDCIAGPSEMIKDKHNGFLVPLSDYKNFQKKLQLLMENQELRTMFGNNARDEIKQFSVEIVGEQYLKLLLNGSFIH